MQAENSSGGSADVHGEQVRNALAVSAYSISLAITT